MDINLDAQTNNSLTGLCSNLTDQKNLSKTYFGGNSLKKVLYLSLFVAAIFIGYTLIYFNQYHIEDEQTAIQAGVIEWLYNGPNIDPDLKPAMKEMIQLDDTNSYIGLIQTPDRYVGYVHFIKGWNGKFKINSSSGPGSNIVDYQKIKTTNGMYAILVGRNPALTIDHIKAELEYEEFHFIVNVSSDELFVRYKHLPKDIKEPFPAELTYYDKNNSEIDWSELMDLIEEQ